MKTGTKKGPAKALLAGLVAIASIGASSVLLPAIAAPISDADISGISFFDEFTPAGVDNKLAEKFETRQSAINARDFPFTPAGLGEAGETLTVAARIIQQDSNRAISVRNAITEVGAGSQNGVAALKKTQFRLTSSKGWQDFDLVDKKRSAVKAPLVTGLGQSSFRLDKGPQKKPSRFKTDISLGRDSKAVPKAQGNAATANNYQLDVGGSFSISRKVDLTAGVRYKNEDDRLTTNLQNQRDSEAVYVGTKIKF